MTSNACAPNWFAEPLPLAFSNSAMYLHAERLAGVRRGQLLGDDRRARRDERALDVGAADADQVHRRRAVRLVDLALGIAALDQPLVRHRRAAARGDDQDRVGVGGDELERLAGDAVSLRAKRSVATSLMPAFSASGLMSVSQASP